MMVVGMRGLPHDATWLVACVLSWVVWCGGSESSVTAIMSRPAPPGEPLVAIPVGFAGALAAARESATDVDNADRLLHAARDALNDAAARHDATRPRGDDLETKSRVFQEGYDTLTDKKKREANDKPCEKIFGACCAKETDDGGKSIKCGGDFQDA